VRESRGSGGRTCPPCHREIERPCEKPMPVIVPRPVNAHHTKKGKERSGAQPRASAPGWVAENPPGTLLGGPVAGRSAEAPVFQSTGRPPAGESAVSGPSRRTTAGAAGEHATSVVPPLGARVSRAPATPCARVRPAMDGPFRQRITFVVYFEILTGGSQARPKADSVNPSVRTLSAKPLALFVKEIFQQKTGSFATPRPTKQEPPR